MFGEEGEVDAIAQPSRAKGIWITEPGFDWRHNGEAFLFTKQMRCATGGMEIRIGHPERQSRDPAMEPLS